MSALDGWMDVCRAGVWRDMYGRECALTEADFDGIVARHAAGDPVPVVVGHPHTDDPAWGWVGAARRVGDRLQVRLRDLAPAFREAVEAGRYAGRSIALDEGAAGLRLRHLGFLGGVAPAVDGLSPTSFSGEPSRVLTFAARDDTAWALDTISRFMRRLREHLIATADQEAADQVAPEWEIETVAEAARMNGEPAFAGAGEGDMPDDDKQTDHSMQAALDRVKAELAQERATRETERRLVEADRALDEHVRAGRVLPAERPGLAALLASLPADGAALSFAAPDGATVSEAPRAVLERLLAAVPARVDYGEHAPRGDRPPDPPTEADPDVSRRAAAFRLAQREAGIHLSAAEAVRAVRRGEDRA